MALAQPLSTHLILSTLPAALRHGRLEREQRLKEPSRLLHLRRDIGVGVLAERLRVVGLGKEVREADVRVERPVLRDVVVRQHRKSVRR